MKEVKAFFYAEKGKNKSRLTDPMLNSIGWAERCQKIAGVANLAANTSHTTTFYVV